MSDGGVLPTLIYVVTNQVTKKQYVGITRQALARRWRGHVQYARKGSTTALHGAIRKYGEQSFSIEVVASCLPGMAALAEADMIIQMKTKYPLGYNLTDGGDGIRGITEETRNKISVAVRGRTHTESARALIGLASIGRKMTDAGRLAIGMARRGKPLPEAQRKKMSIAKLGKKMAPRSKIHSERISAGLFRAWARRKGTQIESIL